MVEIHFRPNTNGQPPNACGDRSLNFVLSVWRHKEVTCRGCRDSKQFRDRLKVNGVHVPA